MKPFIRLTLIILMLLVLAWGSYTGATGLITSMEDYQSPLADNPPAPGAAVGQSAARQLVIILVDALRLDTSLDASLMPTVNELKESGAFAPMVSHPPSYSAPGYGTLFTGAWPEINSGPAFNTEYDLIKQPWSQDNLFSAAHRAGLRVGVSGFNWFEKLIPADAVDLSYYTPGEDNAADEAVLQVALPWLENPPTQVILIHLDQVDYAGHHEGGPRAAGWSQAASRVDGMIAAIVSKLDLTQDTVAIFSDHGQIDAGGHGGTEEIVLREPFILAGKGIIPGVYPEIQMVDVAPTLAALLGTNIPASSQGSAQLQMLDLPAGTVSAAEEQQTAVHAQLTRAYNTTIGNTDLTQDIDSARNSRLARERGWRLPLSLLLALGLPFAFLWRKAQARLPILAGGFLSFAIFQARYALLDGKGYSFSEVSSPTDLVVYCAVTLLIAMTLGFVLTLVLRRQKFTDRWDAVDHTVNYIFACLYFWLLPLIINFWWNGLLPDWTLPQLDVYFWALLGYVGILFSAAGGLLLLAVFPLITTRGRRKQP